jgi:hypothetical protein
MSFFRWKYEDEKWKERKGNERNELASWEGNDEIQSQNQRRPRARHSFSFKSSSSQDATEHIKSSFCDKNNTGKSFQIIYNSERLERCSDWTKTTIPSPLRVLLHKISASTSSLRFATKIIQGNRFK